MTRFACCLLLCAAPVLAAPVPKVLKKQSPLIGVWEVVERQNDGKPIEWKLREIWVIEADEITYYDGVPAAKSPTDEKYRMASEKWILADGCDRTCIDVGMGGPTFSRGRFGFDGDTLQIAFPAGLRVERPAEAQPGPGVVTIKFQRVDDPRPKAK